MTNKLNRKALSILTDDERSALTLQHVHGKSSWEAGEMLSRSHYKYLEIKYRAERFLKIFTDHFILYDDELIPEYMGLSQEFKTYLEVTMLQRGRAKFAANSTESPLMQDNSRREAHIIEQMELLKNSTDINKLNMYALIMEFDRYNNFRIMPRAIQEPSAYKRRNSTRYKKHLKIATTIPLYALKRISDICRVSPKSNNKGWLVLINKDHPDNTEVMPISLKKSNVDLLSQLSFYIFRTKGDANEFYETVNKYISQKTKDPKEGLKFWPYFRNLIKKAINHDTINNIAPTRKSIELAMKDMDTYYSQLQNKAKYNQKINGF